MWLQQYWSDPSKPYKFISVAEFAEHFKSFNVGRQITADLASPPPTCELGGTGKHEPDVRAPTLLNPSMHSFKVHKMCGSLCFAFSVSNTHTGVEVAS